jgi:hypothetical protein
MSKFAPLFIFFQFFSLVILAQKNDAELLNQAYQTGSTQKLYEFCKAWQNELPPINNEELATLDDTLKEAYALFSEFWGTRYSRKTLFQPWSSFKKDSSFVIVQNNLKVYISDRQLYFSQQEIDSFILTQIGSNLLDSVKAACYTSQVQIDSLIVVISTLRKTSNASSNGILNTYRDNISPYNSLKPGKLVADILDFRPQLNPDIHWLYWNKGKYELISQLKNTGTKKQKNDPFNADNVFLFLKKHLLLVPGYMPHRPQANEVYYVFPQTLNDVPSITFDKKLEYALLSFSAFMSGQTDIWHKENGQWQFVKTISGYMGQE